MALSENSSIYQLKNIFASDPFHCYMSEYSLHICVFLEKAQLLPVIDVRSPAEFEHGHIQGAVNMPLFNNEERSVIGTLYLQKGSSEAIMKGLELIEPKLKIFAAEATGIAPEGDVLLHCWRGGMRSNSMAWLLNTVGIKTQTLEGGYKSYRRYIHEFFSRPLNLIVIGGMTGSGKSEVIEELESQGMQVIHLERLARHKGSAFGGIGMPEQPTTEQFENDLFSILTDLDYEKPVFIEDESVAIGDIFIPKNFFEQMGKARFVNMVVPFDKRVERLVKAYTAGDPEVLLESVKRIEKRLGLETAGRIIDFIGGNEMQKAVKLILRYYDKLYTRSMERREHTKITEIKVNNEDAKNIANILKLKT